MPYMPKDCGCWHHHCLTFTNTNSARQELRFRQLKAQLEGSTQELDEKIDANAMKAENDLVQAAELINDKIDENDRKINEALAGEIAERIDDVESARTIAADNLAEAKDELTGRIDTVEAASMARDAQLEQQINDNDAAAKQLIRDEAHAREDADIAEHNAREARDGELNRKIETIGGNAATKSELKTVKEKLEGDMIRQYSDIQKEIASSETLGKDVIVTKTVGYIAEGTKLKKEENIKDIIANMLHKSGVKSASVYFYCGPDISPVMPGLKEFRPVQHGKDVWKQETVDLDTAAAGVTHIFRVDDEPCYFAFAYPMSLGMQLGSSIGELRSIRRGHEIMGSNRNDLAVGGFHTQLCPINNGGSGGRGEKYWLYIFGDDEPELTTEGFMYTFKWN